MMGKFLLFAIAGLLCSTLSIAQNRVVLIEQFSNSSCAPCGQYSPSVYAYANNNSADVAAIAYHTQFPYNNDSMYFENPVEATARVNYYSVSGVPHSVLDGNVFSGSTSNFTGTMATSINNRLAVAPRYGIQGLSLDLVGNQLTGTFKFTSLNAANGSNNLVAHLVVIEKNVLKSAYAASPGANTETEYGYVMRKMLPNANGTSLINKMLNGADSISFNWALSKIKDINQVRVVVFVQNTATQEVYQTQMFSPQINPQSIAKQASVFAAASVYPNPATGELFISLPRAEFIETISIVNQLGAIVYSRPVQGFTHLVSVYTELPNGIYYLRIANKKQTAVQKITILK